MTGTFTNWPRIVERALAAEHLPPPPSHGGARPPVVDEERLDRPAADALWQFVDELPLARPFGISMARVADYADYEELGLALAAVSEAQELVGLLAGYHRLLSDAMNVTGAVTDEGWSIAIESRGPVHWRVHEFGAAIVARLVRARFGPRAHPVAVELAVPRRHPVAQYERYFRCPVTVDASVTELRFSRHLHGHGQAPARIARGLDLVLADALQRLAATPAERVRAELFSRMPHGDVSLAQMARILLVSERTLQRQLAEEHTSFRESRENVVSALALRWVREDGISLNEIADRLGFRSPSAFSRAFRRWHGVTPSEVRRSSRVPAA